MTLGIEELAGRLIARVPLSRSAARRTVAALCEVIGDALLAGSEVRLKGVGVFTTKRVPEKRLRHPGTGEEMVVREHRKLTFRFAEDLDREVRRLTGQKV